MSQAPQPRSARAATANRIDVACDEFERRFRSGGSPAIEAFLDEAAAGDRPRLLQELLALELDLRVQSGNRPAAADYVGRFPAARATIDRLFAELKAASSTFRATDAGQVTSVPAVSTPSEPDGAPVKPPTRLDDFDLLKELGRGGMGIVYQAHQRSLDRVVALKVIRHGETVSDAERQRFRTEAKAAARLDHAGIIPIHQYGEAEGVPYFVMAFVDGPSLAARIRQQPVDERTAVQLVRQLAEAVAYAHEKGIIHRDLKPDNILLAGSSQPRIADFGLARRLEDPQRITAIGQVFGTPAYMSPEQAEGRMEAVGPASDIYALGAILYELLAGRPPFVGGSVLSVLRQVVHDPPPPLSKFNPDVAPALEAICQRCLAKSPSERYSTARELAGELDHFLRETSTVSSPPAPKLQHHRRFPTKSRWLAAAALLLVGLALLIARPLWKSPPRAAGPPAAEQAIGPADSAAANHVVTDSPGAMAATALIPPAPSPTDGPLSVLTGHGHHVWAVQFSADGSHLLSAGEDGTWRLWETGAGNPVATYEDPSGGLLAACFTFDGEQCLTAGFDGIIRLWTVDRGRLVREFRGHRAKVWDLALVSPGKQFVSASEDGTVRLWDIGSGKELHIFEGHQGPVFGVATQPDTPIAASCGADGTIRTWDLQQRSLRQAFPKQDGWIWSVSFASDRRRLFSDGGDRVLEWDPATATLRRRLSGHRDWLYCVLPSAGGSFLLSGGRDGAIILRDLTTGTLLHQYVGHSGHILSLAISPDARKFASGGQNGTIHIWATPEAIASRDRPAGIQE